MGIQYENVGFTYKGIKTAYQALNNITTKIEAEDEIVAIVGQTGSGKTTLAQLSNALLLPTKGNVFVFGQKLPPKSRKEKINHLRQKVGLVFQFPEYQLFEISILKDVAFGPSNFKSLKPHATDYAKKALSDVGIPENLYEQSPFRISGGQMRRVAIAGILAMNPKILVLDEPTRGLDPQGRDEMMSIFLKLHKQEAKSIVLVTHDMDLVAQYAKRVIVLKQGEIVFDGPKTDLFIHPQFQQFHLDYPAPMKVLKHLNEKLNIPFKPVYTYDELLDYLRRVA